MVSDQVNTMYKDAFGLVTSKDKLDDIGGSNNEKLNITKGIENREFVNCKCSACGAMLRGAKGSTVVCEYCGTKHVL